jgi:pyrimidine-specific ribonucleoside hydrolase
VSVVFGNSPLETGDPIAQEIARRFGPEDLPVFRGATSGRELGEETDASRALAEALRREELTILALGPVTNVATVLKNHPELAGQMRKIVAVAGRRPGQKFVLGAGGTPLMDFNFELDSEGFRILLASGVPLVLAPFEIASKTPLTIGEIERFASVPEIADFYLEPLRTRKMMRGPPGSARSSFDTSRSPLTSPDGSGATSFPSPSRLIPTTSRPGG